MIKDHMMSHYKRIYSAKAVIDTSAPKSLTQNVRYSDRMKQERMKKGGRPQSAPSLSHRNSRASCYSAQSRCSVQSEYGPYFCSRNSMLSTPGFSSSFHAKEVPSPSTKAASHNYPHHHRPHSAAELKFRSQEPTSHRRPSACYLPTSGQPSFVKAFRDPAQKTYSGDLLQKHSQHFTSAKPFTPKMLKSEKSSYLSSYRFYRAPRGATKPAQECDNLRSEKRAKTMQHTQELYEPHQDLNKDQQLAENEHTGTYLITPKQQTNKSRDCDPFDYSTRFSLEGLNISPSAEEEELMYLEFISDVTEDMLSRGSVSDRVLNRVIQRHIDMNLHRLDEAKMRHLLDILRNNLDEPSAPSSHAEDLGRKDLLDSLLVMPESALEEVKTEEDNDIFSYVRKHDRSPEHRLEPVLTSSALWFPERKSVITANAQTEEEENNWEKVSSERVSSTEGEDEEEDQPVVTEQQEADSEATHEENVEDHAEVDVEGQSKEVEDLERRFSESLHVDQDAKVDNLDSSSEHQTNTLASVSDDSF
ncbi:spermatogenesis-associated protein 7 homolog isoform X2 [Syngnathoides biaculeatus]|nr:spermatogenesis-associated protein 7 homolog isoform X2 [Syngnathoides biaculeatus]XP_061699931.1 spermatogenesis-associated protein 7 homolog isoform X2 [Syngnathoides biaculeatus]XP_061699932.1 spermatogenesis-associated protein 7 homolog isoform X2 [Syngnathoides biaculeatus]XP_061699933.1 spermatogenesis-associated protein 7 homolog isoform X2 [Syngnathoides biaculeatus]